MKSKVKLVLIGLLVAIISIAIAFNQYLYFRWMSFGATYSYSSTLDKSIVEFYEEVYVKPWADNDYESELRSQSLEKVEIDNGKIFVFYYKYSESSYRGFGACALKDWWGNWFISEYTTTSKFVGSRNYSISSEKLRESLEKSYPEEDKIVNRCNFKDYTHDKSYIEFMGSKKQ